MKRNDWLIIVIMFLVLLLIQGLTIQEVKINRNAIVGIGTTVAEYILHDGD